MVSQAASLFELPEAWVKAVMVQESGGGLALNGRPIRTIWGLIDRQNANSIGRARIKRQTIAVTDGQ